MKTMRSNPEYISFLPVFVTVRECISYSHSRDDLTHKGSLGSVLEQDVIETRIRYYLNHGCNVRLVRSELEFF